MHPFRREYIKLHNQPHGVVLVLFDHAFLLLQLIGLSGEVFDAHQITHWADDLWIKSKRRKVTNCKFKEWGYSISHLNERFICSAIHVYYSGKNKKIVHHVTNRTWWTKFCFEITQLISLDVHVIIELLEQSFPISRIKRKSSSWTKNLFSMIMIFIFLLALENCPYFN